MSAALRFLAVALPAVTCMTVATRTIADAKAALRTALAEHGGNTKVPAVAAAVESLASLCPHEEPAREPSILGNWRQINAPEYAGGTLSEDGAYQYTLGRLTFNVFEPSDLLCTLAPVSNPLKATAEDGIIDYDIEIPFTIETEGGVKLPAELVNSATCTVESGSRLTVAFSGGVMKPSGACDRKAWRDVFGPALAAKRGKRKRVMDWLLNQMMGLVKPSALEEDDAMSYQMTKAPKGFLDVLYLDDELRITRGNRGSLVVCERV